MVGCALAYWTRSDFTQVSKSVKEKSIVQLSCVKVNDATCGHARSIQGAASTYGVHQGNVPQGQRGTQVHGHWHCYKCSTGMFHGARHSTLTSQAHDSSPRFKQAFTLPALHTWTLFAWTPGQYISATLRYGGGGGRPAKVFYHCYP